MILLEKQAALICNSSFQIFFGILAALVPLVLVPSVARCQDAVQLLGTDQQISGNHGEVSNPEYYNLKAGPVNLRFQSGLSVIANDNINYANTNRVADVSFAPGMKVRALWPITLENTLYFNTGISYQAYLKSSDLDHLNINPDSNLAFQLYVSDVAINFHDRFSISDDLSQTPTVSGTGSFLQMDNISGIDAICPLNDLILTVGYDHDWVSYPGAQFEASAHNSDFLYGRAAVTNSVVSYGGEVGTGLTYYDQPVLDDNYQVSAGGFVQAPITEHLSFRASGGLATYLFSTSAAGTNISDIVSYYADLSLNHRINQWLGHSLSAGHRYQESADVDLLELYYVYYDVAFDAIHQVPVTVRLLYEHGKSFGGSGENLDRYGIALKLKYDITQKLTGVAEYDFTDKNSSINVNSYVQNQVTLQLVYNF
jgi:hypothetical protein